VGLFSPSRVTSPLDRTRLRLERALGPSAVLTDPAACAPFARDESEAVGVVPPCVVLARDARDVVETLAACDDARVPVFPRGGATGRTGGAVPVVPGVVLDTTGLDRVVDLDPRNRTVTVGPGVRTAALHALVEREGWFFPPDPQSAEWSCLGGNVAENAGGPRAFKYGVTRDYVLGMDAVVPNGTTLPVGRRTAKGVTGYDLAALLTGSEGTLAVFTSLTLRVVPLPTEVRTLVAGFATLTAAGEAVARLIAEGREPRCVELLDDVCCAVMRAGEPDCLPAGAAAVLVVECDGRHPAAVDREAERVADACLAAGATSVRSAAAAAEREALWGVRRVMSRSLRARARWKLSEDVVVPRPQVPALLDRVRAIAARESIVMPTYGHAGDGNLHVNALWDDEAQRPAVDRAVAALFRETLALGGTLTGEHGVGVAKAPFLPWEQPDELIDLQRRIKAAFDPHGVLNPGKIFAPGAASHRAC
jgi:glycolate oxidase